MRTLAQRCLLLIALLGNTTPGFAAGISWMSEEYPPYNFSSPSGHPQGIAVEMLEQIWRRLGIDHHANDIQIMPWARGYAQLQRKPNTALFSMTYTPAREKQFRFVGPLIPNHVVLLAPKAKQLQIQDPAQLQELIIGVVREDIGEQLLNDLEINPDNLVFSNLASNLVQLLARGRVDAIAYSADVATWNMLRAGIDPSQFENIYTLLEGQLGYAFHQDTDPSLLRQYQQALDQLKAEGQLEILRSRYLQPLR